MREHGISRALAKWYNFIIYNVNGYFSIHQKIAGASFIIIYRY